MTDRYDTNKRYEMRKKKDTFNTLVISGGGSYGAWGCGLAQTLCVSNKYERVIGTSTGALMAPLIAAGKFDVLKEAYTKVQDFDVYKVNPIFNKAHKQRINILNAIWRVIRGKKGLGDTSKLKTMIRKYFTRKTYNYLRDYGIDVIVVVYNMTNKEIEYKSVLIETYDDFCDWIYASTCVPIFVDPFTKNNCIYVDGGLVENTALKLAVKLKGGKIDVIGLTNFQREPLDVKSPTNIFEVMNMTIHSLVREVHKNDYNVQYTDKQDITVYMIPNELDGDLYQSLSFDVCRAEELWWAGFNEGIKSGVSIASML